jgi:hypothetical protein
MKSELGLPRPVPWSVALHAEGARSASTTQRWDRRRHRPTIHRTAAGTREAERQFRRIIGYRDLAKLTTVIDRELDKPTVPTPIEEAAIVVTV